MNIISCLLLTVSLFQVAYANEFRILTVNEPPANYINTSGKADGYVVDIVRALRKEVGATAEIEFVPEARALNILRDKANVLVFSLSKTPFRQEKYLWVGQVLSKKWEVYTLLESELKIENKEQLKNLPVIGVVRGDIREEWLVNHKFTNLHSVTHHNQNIRLLLKERVSAIVFEKLGLAHLCRDLNIDVSLFKSIYTINTSPVFIVMSSITPPDTFHLWHNAYNKLKANGELEKISRLWQAKLLTDFNLDIGIADGLLVF
ncbi:transporter substrate-binding domain-containing protein [Thalassomonas actiniarum]|uniref:Transporter substrate-binding domain-containing protein n=2 Tax=Thalassomonas actiniarum TaxID=485447 RepID=A0AAE9YPS5_9GAMM|nr:transporter substrate-binding domain-containing protein [Thalassomonas actiniarum]